MPFKYIDFLQICFCLHSFDFLSALLALLAFRYIDSPTDVLSLSLSSKFFCLYIFNFLDLFFYTIHLIRSLVL